METRRTLLRTAAVLALAVSILGSTALTPSASAAPVTGVTDLHSVAEKKKDQADKPDKHKHDNDNESSDAGDGLGDVPIIGDVVNQFRDAEPEEIVTGAVQFAGAAAETVIPIIRDLVK